MFAQGEDAQPMRGGSFRVSIGADWQHYTERFGSPTPLNPGLVEGAREPLGFYFGADSFGVRQLGFLTPVQDQIRTLTGLGAYDLNLGRTRVTLDASVRRQPIRIAFAPSTRLGFQVNVPIVRSRMSVFLAAPDTTAAARGNVGTPTVALDNFRLQADAAINALVQQAASGPAGLRAQAQAELAALQPFLCGLSTLGTTSGNDATSPCFGGSARSPFLPLATSEAGDSITTRLGRAQTSYAALRTQYAAQGVTLPPLTELYTLPTVALDSTAIRSLLQDAGPLGADSVAEIVRTGIGDIEVGGWLQLMDAPGWRSQVSLLVRLPTGKMDAPGNFVDIGTGDHQTDVEVGFRNDIVLSRSLWLHAGGRYGVQMADQLVRRVTPYYLPYATAASEAGLDRDLGDYFAIDVAPNWQLDESFGVGIGWHYYHQGATTWSYTNAADEATIGLPASVLGEGTSQSWMRVGAGVTFSTLNRFLAGRAKLPYRVTWSYNSTFTGRGGQVPKAGVMRVEIAAYFGGLH